MTSVALPIATIDTSATNFSQPVATSSIDAADNLIGFQGDFSFDSTVITFQDPVASNAGLTSGNWTITGSILPGPGPIRTLHLSAASNDSTPLSGAGTLFNLNMIRVSSAPGANTALTWAAAQDGFVYVDESLTLHPPVNTPPGSITVQALMTIAGIASHCANAAPMANVTFSLTGDATGSTLSDNSGNYQFLSVLTGGSYTVTPNKSPLAPGSPGISTIDIVATQRHFLNVSLLPGCRLTAADANGDTAVNTIDVVAIQRFFLGLTTGTANVGKYQFSPTSRTYPSFVSDHTSENYDVLVIGDVASPFADRPAGPSLDAAVEADGNSESMSLSTTVMLPSYAFDRSIPKLILPVTTTTIDPKEKLVAFQGDLTFDERVVRFQNEPAQKAGLTGGNWNVSSNVLDGPGPIRTLRISAFSSDLEPLSGAGTLFEILLAPVNNGARNTPFVWADSPNDFIFIDLDLRARKPTVNSPGNTAR